MKGFTLIEVLVVASITILITGLLLANFSRTRVDLNQTTLVVKDAIREAQSLALSGSLSGRPASARCGYGIHFEQARYVVYAGPASDATSCIVDNYAYSAGTVVRQGILSNAQLEIVIPAPDIFFEPPNPNTYIIGSNATTTTITIRRRGTAACPSADCRQINVTTSGQIQ